MTAPGVPKPMRSATDGISHFNEAAISSLIEANGISRSNEIGPMRQSPP